MARFGNSRAGTAGRAIALILFIIAIALGGFVWFDYLGLIDVKDGLAPLYRALGIQTRSKGRLKADSATLLEDERRIKQEEGLLIRNQELDKLESDIKQKDAEIAQKAQEIEERQKALDDQEKSFNELRKQDETKGVNIEQNAVRLTAMPPTNAVAILEAMNNDQDIIDILRKVDKIAAAEGTDSIVPFWMSKMNPKRAADIQRKMTEKPVSPY
jgi:flagellar protein FlbB